MKRLTLFSKMLLFAAILGITCYVLLFFGYIDSLPTFLTSNGSSQDINDINETPPLSSEPYQVPMPPDEGNEYSDKIMIALDEWHGWKAILDANKGINSGQSDSIFQALGLDVEISVINDDEASLQKFIAGEIVAVGVSTNRWAYVHARLAKAGVTASMVIVTDKSAGADGIVTTGDVSGIEGLPGHIIALPKYTVSHSMTEWLLMTSSLSPEQVEEIRKNMIFTSNSEETFEMLSSGRADVAAFWEPYITKARNSLEAKTLFSTRSANNLIINGIIFREDYLNRHPSSVESFIEGTLRAVSEYRNELRYIREFEDYAELSDAEIVEMTDLVIFANFADNRELFDGTIQTLYKEMTTVWGDLGENIIANGSQTAFASSYLLNVAPKFPDDRVAQIDISGINSDNAVTQTHMETLIKQTLTINFEPNVAVIREESYLALADFALIAKILNGAIIQVEGNIADIGTGDTASGRLLSEQRAKAVCDHLIGLGIDETRLIYKGNGITNPLPTLDPRSTQGMEANRRTDIFFITIE